MNPSRRMKCMVGCGLLVCFAAILWIAYTGRGDALYAFLNHVPGGDKTGHVLLMGFLAFALTALLSFRMVKLGVVPIFLGSLAVFLFITVEECAQTLSPNRTFDLADLGCNYLGIALASALCWWVVRVRRV